jgi:hypothetical protein
MSALTLPALLSAHAGRLAVTYGLFGLEACLLLLQPLALGRAVDGLLAGGLAGVLMLSRRRGSPRARRSPASSSTSSSATRSRPSTSCSPPAARSSCWRCSTR